jgi:uncharacterized protein YceH (UPF0502 family)
MPDPLTLIERRVLGVLVEKALTAASPEPLSLNAIVTGSNQKSNRDPVMSLEEPEVDSTLTGLQRKGLVIKVTGGRVERWRHNLYDAWQVGKPELAFLAELLLRGAQTLSEARARASRMEPLDQETVSTLSKDLGERGFVVWLSPEGKRGAKLTHGFHPREELDRLRAGQSVSSPAAESPSTGEAERMSDLQGRLDLALAEITKLQSEVEQLRSEIANLKASIAA